MINTLSAFFQSRLERSRVGEIEINDLCSVCQTSVNVSVWVPATVIPCPFSEHRQQRIFRHCPMLP